MKKIKLFFTVMMVLLTTGVHAQLRTVIGTATDAAGVALPGVSVVVKGTTSGAVTDRSGAYKLEAPQDAVLVFSCIGYKTEQVETGSRQVVNCILEEDTEYLDEVVVTAVGIQRSDRSLGYSVTKVNSDEAVQKAEPDLLRALDGKIAGVQVSAPSGDAGGATRITIRGNSSFMGNNQPLYVVDGVPYRIVVLHRA